MRSRNVWHRLPSYFHSHQMSTAGQYEAVMSQRQQEEGGAMQLSQAHAIKGIINIKKHPI